MEVSYLLWRCRAEIPVLAVETANHPLLQTALLSSQGVRPPPVSDRAYSMGPVHGTSVLVLQWDPAR